MNKLNKTNEKTETLKLLDRISSKSKMTEEDALKLGAKINHEVAKKYLAMEKTMRHAKNSS